jgi:hypothetical protein
VLALVLDEVTAADREEREAKRAKLAAEVGELRAGRGRHVGDRDPLIAAIGEGRAPVSVLARVAELDELVAEADARIAAAERELAALDAQSDAQALRDALVEFDQLWGVLDSDERARVLGLVLSEVIVNGETGEAEIRLRGGL